MFENFAPFDERHLSLSRAFIGVKVALTLAMAGGAEYSLFHGDKVRIAAFGALAVFGFRSTQSGVEQYIAKQNYNDYYFGDNLPTPDLE